MSTLSVHRGDGHPHWRRDPMTGSVDCDSCFSNVTGAHRPQRLHESCWLVRNRVHAAGRISVTSTLKPDTLVVRMVRDPSSYCQRSSRSRSYGRSLPGRANAASGGGSDSISSWPMAPSHEGLRSEAQREYALSHISHLWYCLSTNPTPFRRSSIAPPGIFVVVSFLPLEVARQDGRPEDH